jgi:hypothetical protein
MDTSSDEPLNDMEFESIHSIMKRAMEMTTEGRENSKYAIIIRNFMNRMDPDIRKVLESEVREKQLEAIKRKANNALLCLSKELGN